jgi:outer membrane usher protein
LPTTPLTLAGGALNGFGAAGSALPPSAAAAHQPATASAKLLPAGASDYEFEAGRLRSGWATADAHYGEGYAAAAWRAGLGGALTAEARAEWTQSRTAAGLEMSRGLGPASSVRAGLAQSVTAQESGLRWGMGVVGNSEGAAWTLSWDGYDRGFTPLAATTGETDPRGRVQADASVSLGRGASAGFGYARQTSWDAAPAGVLELSARLPVLARSNLSLKYSAHAGGQAGRQAGVTLDVPLGNDRL